MLDRRFVEDICECELSDYQFNIAKLIYKAHKENDCAVIYSPRLSAKIVIKRIWNQMMKTKLNLEEMSNENNRNIYQ